MLRKLLNRLLSSGRAPVARAPSPAPREDAADRLIAEGNRAEGAGRVQEACERYREAVRAAPGYAKAHLNLGIGLEAAGATEPAARSYEAALAIDPADPFAAYNLGKLLYTRGMPAEAEQLLRQALRSRPGFPEAQVVLSSVLESQGNLGAAAAALETAMRLRPDDFGALYLYAGVLLKQGRLDEAHSALKRALAIDPENADANYSLATLLLARGEPAGAERLLRAVLRRDPHSVDAHARLFEVYELRGDLPAAAAEMEAVLRERPDWADALYNYGCILKKLMRLTDAESAFRRALAVDPGTSAPIAFWEAFCSGCAARMRRSRSTARPVSGSPTISISSRPSSLRSTVPSKLRRTSYSRGTRRSERASSRPIHRDSSRFGTGGTRSGACASVMCPGTSVITSSRCSRFPWSNGTIAPPSRCIATRRAAGWTNSRDSFRRARTSGGRSPRCRQPGWPMRSTATASTFWLIWVGILEFRNLRFSRNSRRRSRPPGSAT